MLIAVAGPYSANSEAARQRNLDAMNRAAAEVYKLGPVPVIGVNAALPVVEFLGVPEEERYQAIMAISLKIVDKCDATLMIGESPGANRERDLVRAKGLPVYNSVREDSPGGSGAIDLTLKLNERPNRTPREQPGLGRKH